MLARSASQNRGSREPVHRDKRRDKRPESQKGFSLPELVVILTAAGAILSPVLDVVGSSMETIRSEQNQSILQNARESLLRYAAQNGGCLPFAADWEGSLPNTGQNGGPGYTDTGVAKSNTRAGDLPWTDLGLGDSFRDGDGLRIQ